MLSKGLLCNIVSVNDLNHEISSTDTLPLVNMLKYVFPDDSPGVSPPWEIYFWIDLELYTKPISIPPYKMTLTELKEFKLHLKDLFDKSFIQPSISH